MAAGDRGVDNPPRDFAGNGAPGVFLASLRLKRSAFGGCLAGVPRAIVFIDGSNWYHGLRRIGVDSRDLDYRLVARKLLVDRALLGVRYYVGKVSGDLQRVRRQNQYVSELRRQGVDVALGRVERRTMSGKDNPLVRRLAAITAELEADLPPHVASQLESLAQQEVSYYVEKQVDVRIAVDMVGLAYRDEYDVAYLLSADGDFAPAVREAQGCGKRVFVASPQRGYQLAEAADVAIDLPRTWFHKLVLH